MISWRRTLAFFKLAGWRKDEFSVLLEAGQKFSVRFRVIWRRPRRTTVAQALADLHDEQVAACRRVLDDFHELGIDSLVIKLREALAPLDVNVWVTAIADQNKSYLEAELLRLKFLRDHVFNDAALGRIWWMSQPSQTVTAIGEQVLLDTLRESRGADITDTSVANAKMLPLLIEFVTWLGGGDHRAELAIKVLDRTFTTLALTDFQAKLHDATGGRPPSEVKP